MGDGGGMPLTDFREESESCDIVLRGMRAGCSIMPSILVEGPD